MRKGFLLCLLLALPLLARAEELDRIVAVINNDAITSVQLAKALSAQEGAATPETRRQILDRLIEDSLMRQRAAEIGLSVSDDEIEAAIADVMRQNRLTREQLETALRQQGINLDDYRQTLQKQILRYKLLGREVAGRSEVSNREVQEYYDANPSLWSEAPTIELQRISFPLAPPADTEARQRVQQRAESAAQALRSGTSFAEVLARAVKDGADGGEMGKVAIDDLNPAFAAAVKDLAVGTSSAPVATDSALHLLVVISRTPGKIRPLDAVREEIRNKLGEKKRATAVQDWIESLKKKAHIDVRS